MKRTATAAAGGASSKPGGFGFSFGGGGGGGGGGGPTKRARGGFFGLDEEASAAPRRKPHELLHGSEEPHQGETSPPQHEHGVSSPSIVASADGKEKEAPEVDPLEAFMSGVHKEVEREKAATSTGPKALRADYEEEDPLEGFMRHLKQKERANQEQTGETDDTEYDSDDVPVLRERSKTIEALPPVDHSTIDYDPFRKDFLSTHPEVTAMSEEQIEECRTRLDIWVSGRVPPRLGLKWDHFGFPSKLLKKIAKQGFTEPTPIQKQAIPTALVGRDILGLAKTGSGKTLAFLLPLLLHIVDQPELQPGEGPIGLIVAPTRELAHQIYIVAQKFSKLFGIRVAAVYGGINRYQQSKKLQEACAIVVCTPGRLIDTIKKRNISMQRVTYLVLDEADKMFDMGFEPQVRSIVGQIRPDRQTLLFSATLKPFVSRLTEEILTNPVRITVGQVGEANADVQQVVEVLEETKKWDWLAHRMAAFVNSGNVLIFVATKKAAEELAANLAKMGWNVAALHGDKVQSERNSIMSLFKSGKTPVLVATDVAARGLDVPLIKTVVNYDSARDISAHTHRIGRTGRAGSQDGVAYSLVTPIEAPFAAELVHNLEAADQHVPPALRQLAAAAKQHQRRYPRGKGKASVPIANNTDPQRTVHRGGVGFALPPSSPFRGISSGSGSGSGSSSSSFGGERTAYSQHKAAPLVPTSHQSVHQAFRPASGSGESGSWKATK